MKAVSKFDYKLFKVWFIPGITLGIILPPILILLGQRNSIGWFLLFELLLALGFDIKSRNEKGKFSFKLASLFAGMVFGNLIYSILGVYVIH